MTTTADLDLTRMEEINAEMTTLGRHERLTRSQEQRRDELQAEFRQLRQDRIDRMAAVAFTGRGSVMLEGGAPGVDVTGQGATPVTGRSRPAFRG